MSRDQGTAVRVEETQQKHIADVAHSPRFAAVSGSLWHQCTGVLRG